MDADPDTLATAPHVTIDDLPKAAPQLAPWRPPVGIAPKLSDAELVTLAAMQALPGFASEARWLRHAGRHLRHLFPDLPGQSGHNQRLRRAAGLIRHATRAIAADTALWTDDGWIVDSPRWRAAARARPPSAPSWRGGPRTAGAPAPGAGVGVAAASGVHPARPADLVRAGRPPGPPTARCCGTL